MKRVLLTGNHAVAWAARLARPKVVPVYLITPQTPVMELLTEFQAAGELDAEILTPESEHSVMAACIPASLAGVRVFTATASQGLMLMHELLHYAAGARADRDGERQPHHRLAVGVLARPDRQPGAARHRLIRSTPKARRRLDSVLQAFRIAERVLLPAMVNLDAFYVSHALEPVRCRRRSWSTTTCRRTGRSISSTPAAGVVGQRGEPGHVLPPSPRDRRRDGPRARSRAGGRPRVVPAHRPHVGPHRALPLRGRRARDRHHGQHAAPRATRWTRCARAASRPDC